MLLSQKLYKVPSVSTSFNLGSVKSETSQPPFATAEILKWLATIYIGWVCWCCFESVACIRKCSLEKQVISKWSLGIRQLIEMWAPKPNCPYLSIIHASTRSPYSCNSPLPLPILLFKHLCFNISIWIFAGFGISPELGYFNLLHLKSFLDCLWKYFIMIIIINDENDNMAYSLSGGFICIYLSHLV